MQRTFTLSLACQAVSKDRLCPLTCLQRVSPAPSVTEKCHAKGWSQGRQEFQATAGPDGTISPSKLCKQDGTDSKRRKTPFDPTSPSTTSKQLNIPNTFIDYKRCLELDASLHTQKRMLPHAKYHCGLKYFWDKESATDAAKWELLTGMK